MRILVAALVGTGVVWTGVAAAEVMDKEPTLVVIWAWAILGGALAVLGWRLRRWAGAVRAACPGAFFAGLHFELADPHVGSAIVEEAGQRFVRSSHGALERSAPGCAMSHRRQRLAPAAQRPCRCAVPGERPTVS